MNEFTLQPGLTQSLTSLRGLTALRDADGKVIGYFSPSDEQTAALYAAAATHLDRDEKDRRKAAGETGLTTVEMLEQLEDAGQQP
ncbi:MAG: hypothetical protein AAGA92_15945 [Planctomycetota bacterium]